VVAFKYTSNHSLTLAARLVGAGMTHVVRRDRDERFRATIIEVNLVLFMKYVLIIPLL
jgi:hypothetical protein